MSCPDPRAIESLACGVGDEKERLALMDHVANCPNCRQEWAFLRLIQLQHHAQAPEDGHLDDEAFCALADRALDEKQSRQAWAHLATCPICLSQWVGLHRNLETAEEAEQSPPAALLEKALNLAKIDAKEHAESWWSGLFNVARPWQWGLAWGATAAVLLATLWFGTDVPHQQDQIDLAQIDLTQLQKSQSAVAVKNTVKNISPEGPGQNLPHPPKPSPPVLADASPPKPQTTPLIDLSDLARRSLPLERLQTRLAHGLSEEKAHGLRQAYKLGRLLAYNQRFVKASSQSDIRQLLAVNTESLAAGLKQAGQTKLADMASGLFKELNTDMPALGVLQARLDVLHQATSEWLDTAPDMAAGACLGKLIQSWHMRQTNEGWAMSRLRSCRNKVGSLSADDPAQQALLSLLDAIAKAKSQKNPEAMKALDRLLSSPAP